MSITVYVATSANGLISNARNVPDWLSAEYGRGFVEICREKKAVIMGRKTYDILAPDHLPLSDEGVSVVLTTRAGITPANRTVVFTSAHPREIAALLEEKGHREAVIIGGTTTISQFLDAELVNDIVMVVEPVLFGGEASPLWRGAARDHKLELVGSPVISGDTLRLHYRLAGRAR